MGIYIENYHDLMEHVQEYQRKFPKSYTCLEEIKANLEREEMSAPGHIFGISVATEWPDKCFGFELEKQTSTTAYFRYLGIWKC